MSHLFCARVYVLDAPYHIDKLYDYYIPADLREDIHAGIFAAVPFGKGNRASRALVWETKPITKAELEQLKPIKAVLSDMGTLNDEQMGLVEFLRDRTFCSAGDAVRAMLPSATLSEFDYFYEATGKVCARALSPLEKEVEQYIIKEGRTALKKLTAHFGEKIIPLLKTLEKDGIIHRDFEFKENTNKRYITYLTPTPKAYDYISGQKKLRSEKQLDILRFTCECGRLTDKYLKQELDVSAAQIRSLVAKELLSEEKVDCYRNPYDFPEEENPRAPIVLNECQQKAKETLSSLYASNEPKAALLHGITGSGKTSVIKAMTDEVLASGRQVIILIPEIALTPQALSVFGAYYGDNIALMHSSLSKGERFDAYRRMEQGLVNVCIGTRSAIFAPFKNLGMIVIDEEQEHTYKAENSPRYSAVDVARYRCARHSALMLLASATPCVSSYYKAESGKYTLVELDRRYGEAKLPEAVICDMREEFNRGSLSAIGTHLKDEIEESVSKNEQAVIFLNRRGYSNYASCPQCGEVVMCPHCSVSLTRHNYRFGAKLVCHYCGYSIKEPENCPNCGGNHLQYIGYGTQKVQEELQELFPDKKVMRMDADTTTSKFAYDEMLAKFRAHEGDILLGTQMVTKGHDFPDVTLSGVLLADMSLYLDDFRAPERTFSLITQVIGRAGRAKKEGRAVIQTFNPEHPVLRLAALQDYKTFYKNEIALRRTLLFPPFCDIFLVTLSGVREEECIRMAHSFYNELVGHLKNNPSIKLVIFGPFEAPVYKVNNRFRQRFVMKGISNKPTRELLRHMIIKFTAAGSNNTTITIDVNPNTL